MVKCPICEASANISVSKAEIMEYRQMSIQIRYEVVVRCGQHGNFKSGYLEEWVELSCPH